MRSVLGRVRLSAGTSLPDWAETLAGIVDSLEDFRKEEENAPHRAAKPHVPFSEIYLAFVKYARKKLMEKIRFNRGKPTESCLRPVEGDLVKGLEFCAHFTFLEEFFMFSDPIQISLLNTKRLPSVSVFSSDYQAFIHYLIKEGLVKFFTEYPVLARLMATLTTCWIETHAELLVRLQTDWGAISRTFCGSLDPGKVTGISHAGSQDFKKGKTVLSLTFDSGLKIIYKPRDLGVEEAFFRLLSWIGDQRPDLRMKGVKHLNRGEYGWVEFVEELPCSSRRETSRHYKKMGVLLAILYCLGAKDAHPGNIMGSGEYPVLVDAEIVMCPRHALFDDANAHDPVTGSFVDSVLEIGLLPFRHGDEKRRLMEYKAEIVIGFERMYRFLITHRQELLDPDGPMKGFSNHRIRYLLRFTKAYCNMTEVLLKPRYLQDGADFSIALELLCSSNGEFEAQEEQSRKYWPIRKAELKALAQLDIPVFSTWPESLDLMLPNGHTLCGFFKETGYDRTVDRLNRMNAQNLEQQIGCIKAALHPDFRPAASRFCGGATTGF